MGLRCEQARIEIESQALDSSFDRVPFGFAHNLCELDLLGLSELAHLAALYTDRDYFVAFGAPTPDAPFYSVAHSDCAPQAAMRRLDSGNQRILLKRPEKYDRRFGDLLETLFSEIVRMRGGLAEKIIRLESSILISSSATITPFHFDPEISFFFQIAGNKFYHIYSPAAVSEPELEAFYVKGITNIAQVALAGRDPAQEHVFALRPGSGMHQPRNAPHWVQTSNSISISYTVSFETDVTRALGRTRAFNYYARTLGLSTGAPGARPNADRLKGLAMQVFIPARKTAGSAFREAGHWVRAGSVRASSTQSEKRLPHERSST